MTRPCDKRQILIRFSDEQLEILNTAHKKSISESKDNSKADTRNEWLRKLIFTALADNK